MAEPNNRHSVARSDRAAQSNLEVEPNFLTRAKEWPGNTALLVKEKFGPKEIAALGATGAMALSGCANDEQEPTRTTGVNDVTTEAPKNPEPQQTQTPKTDQEEDGTGAGASGDLNELAPESFKTWREWRETVPDPDCAPNKEDPAVTENRQNDGDLEITLKARNASDILERGELIATVLTGDEDGLHSSLHLDSVDGSSGEAKIVVPTEEAEDYREAGLVVMGSGQTPEEIIKNMPTLEEQEYLGIGVEEHDNGYTVHNADQYVSVFFADKLEDLGVIIKTDIVELCSIYYEGEEQIRTPQDYLEENNPRDFMNDAQGEQIDNQGSTAAENTDPQMEAESQADEAGAQMREDIEAEYGHEISVFKEISQGAIGYEVGHNADGGVLVADIVVDEKLIPSAELGDPEGYLDFIEAEVESKLRAEDIDPDSIDIEARFK